MMMGQGKSESAPEDLRQLVQDLALHQLELQTQNEELRAARVEIESGLARYTELFQFAPIGYAVVSATGLIRKMNLAAIRMLACERLPADGMSFLNFVDRRSHGDFQAFLTRTLAHEARFHRNEICELKLRALGKETFDVRLTAALVDSRAPEVMVAIEDVTAQKRAEAALRHEIARRDEFLAVLSHELRNPLSPIRSSVSLLDGGALREEESRKALSIIDRQVTHLTRIVDDLLDVARIARGMIALQREHFELSQVVQDTVDDHRASFEAAGISLAFQRQIETGWVYADPTRLVKVVGNLLANALKFTQRGGRVDVVLRDDSGMATLSVRDDGAGIEPGMNAEVFEPFVQGPQNLDRKRGGLGLGLAMVKELMRLHGGRAEATSAGRGCGSEFTVRLPLTADPVRVAPPAPALEPRPQRVLLIEDNEDTAEALSALLVRQGHEVLVALDGCTGVAMARDTRPDVVLCDLGLPGLDGYGVAREIRADERLKSIYLVALSGYALPEDRKLAAAAGFDHHIAKPPTLAQLREIGSLCRVRGV